MGLHVDLDRLVCSLRCAVAVIACYILYHSLHLRHGYWSVITAVLISEISIGGGLNKGWQRIVGTSLGSVLGHVTVLMCRQSKTAIGLALFALIFAVQYFARRPGTKFQYAWTITGMTTSMIMLLESQTAGLNFVIDRITEISLGVAIVWTVSLVVFPFSAKVSLDVRIAQFLQDSHALFTLLCDDFATNKSEGNESVIGQPETLTGDKRLNSVVVVVEKEKGSAPSISKGTHAPSAVKTALLKVLAGHLADQRKLLEDALHEVTWFRYPDGPYRSIIAANESVLSHLRLAVDNLPLAPTERMIQSGMSSRAGSYESLTSAGASASIAWKCLTADAQALWRSQLTDETLKEPDSDGSELSMYREVMAQSMHELALHSNKLVRALVATLRPPPSSSSTTWHPDLLTWLDPAHNPYCVGLAAVLSRYDFTNAIFLRSHFFRRLPLDDQIRVSTFAHAVRAYLSRLPALGASIGTVRSERRQLRFRALTCILALAATIKQQSATQYVRLKRSATLESVRNAMAGSLHHYHMERLFRHTGPSLESIRRKLSAAPDSALGTPPGSSTPPEPCSWPAGPPPELTSLSKSRSVPSDLLWKPHLDMPCTLDVTHAPCVTHGPGVTQHAVEACAAAEAGASGSGRTWRSGSLHTAHDGPFTAPLGNVFHSGPSWNEEQSRGGIELAVLPPALLRTNSWRANGFLPLGAGGPVHHRAPGADSSSAFSLTGRRGSRDSALPASLGSSRAGSFMSGAGDPLPHRAPGGDSNSAFSVAGRRGSQDGALPASLGSSLAGSFTSGAVRPHIYSAPGVDSSSAFSLTGRRGIQDGALPASVQSSRAGSFTSSRSTIGPAALPTAVHGSRCAPLRRTRSWPEIHRLHRTNKSHHLHSAAPLQRHQHGGAPPPQAPDRSVVWTDTGSDPGGDPWRPPSPPVVHLGGAKQRKRFWRFKCVSQAHYTRHDDVLE